MSVEELAHTKTHYTGVAVAMTTQKMSDVESRVMLTTERGKGQEQE